MMKPLLFLGSFLIGMAIPQSDRPPLNLKECIEIAAEYEVLHPIVPNNAPFYGVTDFDGKKIFVIHNASLAQRRRTAIHEMIHAARQLRGDLAADDVAEEQIVHVQADALYKELFGQ